MKSALGIGLVALAGVTLVSVGMSVIIPADNARAARTETRAALGVARLALTRAGRSCDGTPVSRDGLTADMIARAGRCIVRVRIPAGGRVPASVRGARLSIAGHDGGIRCEAQGGHGADAADFPGACRYRGDHMLL